MVVGNIQIDGYKMVIRYINPKHSQLSIMVQNGDPVEFGQPLFVIE